MVGGGGPVEAAFSRDARCRGRPSAEERSDPARKRPRVLTGGRGSAAQHPIGADVALKPVRGGEDVVGLACGFGSLSQPEGGIRIAELAMSRDEGAGHEVQDLVECMEEAS